MMENPHAVWRIEVARKLSERVRSFPGVRAMAVAGSVARGYADEYSDIEIPIFWDALPDDETRHAMIDRLDASLLYTYDGPSREDQLLIHGLQVDFWHVPVTRQEAVIREVLESSSTDLGNLNAMDTIRWCIPLYGQSLIEKWKKQAQAYPDELAKRLIQEQLSSFSVAELFLMAVRDNPTAFHGVLSRLQRKMFLVLLALNRRYFPTYKWLYRLLDEMQVKPEDIARRFRRAFASPPLEALADTRELLLETLGLVEQQFPEVDTTRVRSRLGYTRAAHTQAVRV